MEPVELILKPFDNALPEDWITITYTPPAINMSNYGFSTRVASLNIKRGQSARNVIMGADGTVSAHGVPRRQALRLLNGELTLVQVLQILAI